MSDMHHGAETYFMPKRGIFRSMVWPTFFQAFCNPWWPSSHVYRYIHSRPDWWTSISGFSAPSALQGFKFVLIRPNSTNWWGGYVNLHETLCMLPSLDSIVSLPLMIVFWWREGYLWVSCMHVERVCLTTPKVQQQRAKVVENHPSKSWAQDLEVRIILSIGAIRTNTIVLYVYL